MRRSDAVAGSLFSYVDFERRIRADHPLRVIREIVNATLVTLSPEQALSACFVHPLAIDAGLDRQLGLHKALLPATGTCRLTKADMLRNDACPDIRVDPQRFDVHVDGVLATCAPATELPLAQRYMLR